MDPIPLLQALARAPAHILCHMRARYLPTRVHGSELLYTSPCDPIHAELHTLGSREPWFTRILEKLIRTLRPTVAVDVGANIGYYIALYKRTRRLWGVPNKIYAVEPSARSLPLLASNLPPNARLLPLALGDRDTRALLTHASTPNLDHIAPLQDQRDKMQGQKVLMARLDTLLTKGILECPQLLRMDVEGYELRVLLGARRLLKECGPVLAIEVHPHSMKRYGDQPRKLLSLLQDAGYRIVYFEWGPKTPLMLLTFHRKHYWASVPKTPVEDTMPLLREGIMLIALPRRTRRCNDVGLK